MQIPPENGGERNGIEMQVAVGTFHDQAEPPVQILPLRTGKIGIRQRDAMRAVAHPIHQAQRGIGQELVVQVIFKEHKRPRHPRGFAQ